MGLRKLQLIAGLALLSAGGVFAADMTRQESQLQAEEQRINQDTTRSDAVKTADMSKQFGVTTETVQKLRTAGDGWGGVFIQLATAQEITKRDSATYPTMDAALSKVSALRSSGEGWGKVAQDLGFKLGPVISAARRAWRPERAHGGPGGMNHPEHPQHPDHPEQQTHPEHPDHPTRPQRPGGTS
jgi:hypothetical protein